MSAPDPILDALQAALAFAQEELQVNLDSYSLDGIRETLEEDGTKYVKQCNDLIANLEAAISARRWEQLGGPE